MKRQELLVLSVIIFATAIVWVLVEVVRLQYQQVIDREVELPPLREYNIDEEVFDKLEQKQ